MFNAVLLSTIFRYNKGSHLTTRLCSFSIIITLLALNIVKASANEDTSTQSASSANVELIPDYEKHEPAPKVNSITHQEHNDPRNLEVWPAPNNQVPFSHKVLYQAWKTPDSDEDKVIDSQTKQQNNQAFLKWLKQLNQEKE
ncbi:hypothetical protein [uncultured Shewanella sp.]|uniref:hypothetical protein n=1 Tax=uncultured Shewanella sp. TaxID=173975 RepID=UPI00261CFE4B|nr:hypothetical protein [uncultured Shewanella sp.]